MGKFFKWLGIYIGLMALILFLSVGLDSIFGTNNQAIFNFSIRYVSIFIGIFCFFFLVLQVSAELDHSSFFIDLVALIFGGVGYLLFSLGLGAYGSACLICATGITSIGACEVSDRLFSYYEEEVTTSYKWNNFLERWDEVGKESVIRYVDMGTIGYILHLIIFLAPCYIFKDPKVYLILFFVFLFRFVRRNFVSFIIFFHLLFHSIIHPMALLKFIGKTWVVFLIVVVGLSSFLIVRSSIKNKGKKEEEKEKPKLSYTVYDQGSILKSPSCESDGEFIFTSLNEENKTVSYKMPSPHHFDSNNKCTLCGYELEFNKDLILYKAHTDYIEIYGFLPGNGDLIIPPYIDGLKVSEIHFSAYSPNYNYDEYNKDIFNTYKCIDLKNETKLTSEYGFFEYDNAYIYAESKDTNLYFDLIYDKTFPRIYIIGDINNAFLNNDSASLFIFTGSINNFYSRINANVTFMSRVRAIYSSMPLFLQSRYLSLPKGLEYFYAFGTYYGFTIESDNKYLKVKDNNLYSSDYYIEGMLTDIMYSNELIKKLKKNKYNLLKSSITFDPHSYKLNCYDYRYDKDGFRLPLPIITISNKQEFIDNYKYFSDDEVKIRLTGDIDFEGESQSIFMLNSEIDGNGYSLKNVNLEITNDYNSYRSSFGFIEYINAPIHDLTLDNFNITIIANYINPLEFNAGILTGSLNSNYSGSEEKVKNISIINSSLTLTESSGINVGGAIGSLYNSTLSNIICDNVDINILSLRQVENYSTKIGGVIGLISNSTLYGVQFINSSINGKLEATSGELHYYRGFVGGLIGYSYNNSYIEYSLVSSSNININLKDFDSNPIKNNSQTFFTLSGFIGLSDDLSLNIKNSIIFNTLLNENIKDDSIYSYIYIKDDEFILSDSYNLYTDLDCDFINYNDIKDEYLLKKVDFNEFILPNDFINHGFINENGIISLNYK